MQSIQIISVKIAFKNPKEPQKQRTQSSMGGYFHAIPGYHLSETISPWGKNLITVVWEVLLLPGTGLLHEP